METIVIQYAISEAFLGTEQELDRHRHMTLGKVVVSIIITLVPILFIQGIGVVWILGSRSSDLDHVEIKNVEQDKAIIDVGTKVEITAKDIKKEQKQQIDDLEDKLDDKFTMQNNFIDRQIEEIKAQIRYLFTPPARPTDQ